MPCSHFLIKLQKSMIRLFCFLHTLVYHTKTLFEVHIKATSTHNLNDEDAGKSHSRYEFVKQNYRNFRGRAEPDFVHKIVQESVRIFTTTKIRSNKKQLCKQAVKTGCQSSTARNFNSKKCSTSAVLGGSS